MQTADIRKFLLPVLRCASSSNLPYHVPRSPGGGCIRWHRTLSTDVGGFNFFPICTIAPLAISILAGVGVPVMRGKDPRVMER